MAAPNPRPAANVNAQAGPSKPRVPSPQQSASASPINMVDELDPEEPGAAAAAGAGAGAVAVGGISRNGLSVDENGEVTKVPAFLTKLYSMVNDPDTDELIHWSPKGDSFLIPYQEQLARQILPRFFKHSNFQSFVRQLNMYAFLPHNAATPSGEAELWEFINPLFKKGQPDLLGRITRRQRAGAPAPTPISTASSSTGSRSSARQAAQQTQVASPGGGFHPVHLITDGTTTGEASTSGGIVISPQGLAELSAITSGIAAIQRTQASIGADLKALQSSNELLWREAMEQREKHKKHQETIDLIVSFLERLFGTDGEGLKGLKEAMRRSGLARTGAGAAGAGSSEAGSGDEGAGSARKKRRLGLERMISDGREEDGDLLEISSASQGKKSRFDDSFMPRANRTRSSDTQSWDNAANRFTTLPSDGEPSPFSSTPTPVPRPASTDSASTTDPFAMALAPYNPNSNLNSNNPGNQPGAYPQFNTDYTPPGQHPAGVAPGYNLDPALLQTTIGSLLQSPAAAQMFLNSLKTSAQAQNLPHQPTPYSSHQHPDPTLALFNPLPSPRPLEHEPLLDNQAALLKSYEDAMNVGGDVAQMQKGIDELVRSMGLDVGGGGGAGGMDGGGMMGQGGGNGLAAALSPDSAAGPPETSLDDIFGIGGGKVGEGLDPEMDIPEGFDVDQFLQSLQGDGTPQ